MAPSSSLTTGFLKRTQTFFQQEYNSGTFHQRPDRVARTEPVFWVMLSHGACAVTSRATTPQYFMASHVWSLTGCARRLESAKMKRPPARASNPSISQTPLRSESSGKTGKLSPRDATYRRHAHPRMLSRAANGHGGGSPRFQ